MPQGFSSLDLFTSFNNLDHHAFQSTEVDSFTCSSDLFQPFPSEISYTGPADSSLLKIQRQRSFSAAASSSNNGRKSGFLSKLRRASTSIKTLLNTSSKKPCRDTGSNSSSREPSFYHEKDGDIIISSSNWVAADLALRCKTALQISPPARSGTFAPTHVSLDPFTGAAARASAACANQNALNSKHRNDSNIALSQSLGEDGENGFNFLGVDMSMVHQARERRNSRVYRKDPLSCLPGEIASLVFNYLGADALAQASLVSKKWANVAADQHVWRRAFLDKYQPKPRSCPLPLTVGGTGIGKPKLYDQDWKMMYKSRSELESNWQKGNAMAVYLNGHTDSVYCVQYNEEFIITGSRDRTFRIWDINTYECIKVVGIPAAYETDRRELASQTPHPLTLPDDHVVHPNPARALNPDIYHVPRYYHNASILCLQFDDEIMVTGSSDCTLIIWDIKTWQPIHCLRSHTAGVLDIAFDKEKIISCSKDATLCVWDRDTGDLLQRITGHMGPVNAVQLRGNLVVSASGEGCARLWNLGYQHQRRRSSIGGGWDRPTTDAKCVKEFWSKDRGLACVEFSDDAKYVLAGGNDQVIYKFDTQTGKRMDFDKGHENLVRSLYLDEGNSRVVSGSYDSSLRVWDYEKGAMTMCFPHWTSSWMLSAKSDYRRIVCTSQDGRALILDFGWGVEHVGLLKG